MQNGLSIDLVRRRGVSLGATLWLAMLTTGCVTDSANPVRVVAEPPEPTRVTQRFVEPAQAGDTDAGRYRVDVPGDVVRVSAPDVHVVVKGDTLWDISARFLNEPWLWPQIWDYNPQIENPHLIYPGDRIALEYVDGYPTLVISRDGGATGGTERLSPRVRTESLDRAIPTIPGDEIAQFLLHPRVVSLQTLDNAPYIVGNFDERLISATGHQVYARGDLPAEQTDFGVFRRHKPLVDPATDELLGYEVSHVADAKLLNRGDPATLSIVGNRMETIAGDLLLPRRADPVAHSYVPRMPRIEGQGRIVSLVNAISQSGRDQVVVLNLGERSGVEVGDVLAIEARGKTVIDRHGKKRRERVLLPNVRTGVAMVFQTFDKVSYALVMESTRPISVDDIVTGI